MFKEGISIKNRLVYLILGSLVAGGLSLLSFFLISNRLYMIPKELAIIIMWSPYVFFGVLIYTIVILLIDRHRLLNTEEMKKKKLAKLQKKIERIKKD